MRVVNPVHFDVSGILETSKYTEHETLGSNVLNSPEAVEMSAVVVHAFVWMRQALAMHTERAHKLAELERKIGAHDEQIQIIFDAIRQLMTPPSGPKKRRIGFLVRHTSCLILGTQY